MQSSSCSQKTRERISNAVRQRLSSASNFACSICGSIPIVFHHIDEWAKSRSNAEQYLITVCDKCHRGIHGEGGSLFSKAELYEYKNNPQKPAALKDKLPLEAKRGYSFFIGSNFIEHGEKSSLIGFQGGHRLTTIDTSGGKLKLSILGGIRDGNLLFVIKDNELLIETHDVWNMAYSRNSLKIWRTTDNKKTLFINLILLSDVIIIREMNTTFNGIPFRIFKVKTPQRRQIEKLQAIIKSHEEIYINESNKIDRLCPIDSVHDGVDLDAIIKETRKDLIKTRLQQNVMFHVCKSFKWNPIYYQMVLSDLLDKSHVFGKKDSLTDEFSNQIVIMKEKVSDIREKYSDYFDSLKNVVVEYGGVIFNGTITL